MPFLYILIFIISCFVLAGSGSWIVKSLAKIARFFGWREFIVASFIMTFAASLPELFVGISSALHGEPILALGNVMGTNIVVLTLIIGIGGLMAGGLTFEGKTLQRASLRTALIGSLPLFLMLDGEISRWNGVILYGAGIFYFYQLIRQEKKFSRVFPGLPNNNKTELKSLVKTAAVLLAGIFLLLASAEGLVWSASSIAVSFNLSLPVIGLLVIALGTSVPEIVFGVKSISMGYKEMILGNVMGGVVLNSTIVLGTVALISPFEVGNLSPYLISISFTVAIAFLFAVFAKTDEKITRRESLVLLFIYLLFLTIEALIG